MTTVCLGVDQYSLTSMLYRSSNSSPRSHSSSSIYRSGLPSPPGSTRTSIDTSSKAVTTQTLHTDAAGGITLSLNVASALPSPPQSQPGSPSKTKSIDRIFGRLQQFFESGRAECEIDGVTPALLERVKECMVERGQAGTWENLR
jgi:hypothetical protein